jgi:hypothetical protein
MRQDVFHSHHARSSRANVQVRRRLRLFAGPFTDGDSTRVLASRSWLDVIQKDRPGLVL